MSINNRFLTIKSLTQIISKACLSPEKANHSRGIFFIGDIVEELLWFRTLIKSYNGEISRRSHEEKIRSIFNPRKLYFEVKSEHFAFEQGFKYDVIQFNEDFSYSKTIYVKYKGIFNFSTKLKNRPMSFEKLDETWCFPLWKKFYVKRPTADDISISLINSYFMIFTEMQRSLIFNDRSEARKQKSGIDDEIYWKVVDALRDVFVTEKTLDLKNPKVFSAITDLVNGTTSFYFRECDYPCINVLYPHLFDDQNTAFVWCFNNLRKENFGLISGFLKNFSKKDSSIPIGLFEHDSTAESKHQYCKTTPHSLFRSFLGYIKDAWASGNSKENLENRLELLERLIDIVNKSFLDFPEDQRPTMDGNDVDSVF